MYVCNKRQFFGGIKEFSDEKIVLKEFLFEVKFVVPKTQVRSQDKFSNRTFFNLKWLCLFRYFKTQLALNSMVLCCYNLNLDNAL